MTSLSLPVLSTRFFSIALLTMLAVVLLTLPSWSRASVRECYEGDTCKVNDNTVFYMFKVHGIDAPELDQPYGTEARNAAKKMLKNRWIQLKCTSGFLKTKVCHADMDGQDVAALLVQQGFAWDSPKESFGKYKRYEREAREAKRGLWAAENPDTILSPYCWREPSSEQCNDPRFMP
jgi:endonuclease YncB( thermonuclease family)